MAKDHMASLKLENAVRSAIGVQNRGILGGVVDADFIDHHGAFTAFVAGLSPYYKAEDKGVQAEIDELIMKFDYLNDKKISDSDYNSGVEKAANALRDFINSRK